MYSYLDPSKAEEFAMDQAQMLNLAQTFVQQHHGLIECDSVPGRTDFKILIPLP